MWRFGEGSVVFEFENESLGSSVAVGSPGRHGWAG